jgi:hypothetical protein
VPGHELPVTAPVFACPRACVWVRGVGWGGAWGLGVGGVVRGRSFIGMAE